MRYYDAFYKDYGTVEVENNQLSFKQIQKLKKIAIPGSSCFLICRDDKYDYDEMGRIYKSN